ncbi:MAG: SapC family protein [Pseudomonadales bacterium]|nr:SapC family protein [Pseudomonadales bacterium]
MANLLFYDKPVALNKVTHKDYRIKPVGSDFAFARKTNSVILAGVEFTEAAKEYPIVFAKAGESIVPVALLGLRPEENLFVDASGKWDARYVPAFVRRYPFVLAETAEQGQRMVCIDEAYPGFNKAEGELLFENGEPTQLLKQAMDFLEEYQKQYARTERFVKRLVENELLMSLNARVDMVDGQQFSLNGLLAVDEKKLLALPDDKALEFFRSGELGWLYCHLMSIGTMARMVDRAAGVKSTSGVAQAKAGDKIGSGATPGANPRANARETSREGKAPAPARNAAPAEAAEKPKK